MFISLKQFEDLKQYRGVRPMNEKERIIFKLFKELGIALTNNQGENRTFLEVTKDIGLIFNKLTTSQREQVVSMLFYQNNEKRNTRMNMSEYQSLVERAATQNDGRLVNYAFGIVSEAEEVAELFNGHNIGIDEIREKLGDVLWCIANITRIVGLTLDDVAVANVTKLQKFYLDGFNAQENIDRKD